MNSSSRTSLRLQLMREQSLIDQHKGGSGGNGSKESFGSMSPGSSIDASSSSPMAIRVSASNPSGIGGGGTSSGMVIGSNGSGGGLGGGGTSVKTSPIIISQPIRFTGNRLVHLPPQIIHVQQQHQQHHQLQGGDNDIMGRRNLILSSSLPPGLPQNTPPKPGMTAVGRSAQRVVTPQQQYQIQQHQPRQHRSSNLSKHSPSELSPSAGNCESPSASFTSAQSELDDIIIDEILSMEEEQRRLDPTKMPSSLSYANNLEGYMGGGGGMGRVAYSRQVSSSAPTSVIDIEGMVRDELSEEHDLVRDRRKKDIHNMIERRRRYNINDRIKELGTLLPKGCTEEMKLNKGTILKASVEYIRAMRRDQEKMYQQLQRYQHMEQDNKTLLLRIQELEELLTTHGVPVPPVDLVSLGVRAGGGGEDGSMDHPQPRQSSYGYNNRTIKAEPLDEEQTPQPMPNHPAPAFHAPAPPPPPPPPPPPQPQNAAAVARPMAHHQQTQESTRTSGEYNPAMAGGHSYAISDAQFSSFYSSTIGGGGGSSAVLETPPIVNNNLTPFGQHHQSRLRQQQTAPNASNVHQDQQHLHELMMDLGGGSGLPQGDGPSQALLVSSADPLMSDSRLINSQVASPEIQWEAQAFSPEAEQMDFTAP